MIHGSNNYVRQWEKETMTDDEIADLLARTLDDRRQLLKIMSMNHYGNVRKVPQRYGF